MPAPRQETFVRLTDVVADRAKRRLGNSGTADLKDLVDRLDLALGHPVELHAADPADTTLVVEPGEVTLPDGRRLAVAVPGAVSALAAGVIDFAAGTISTGTNPTFTLPSLGIGNYVRALVSYSVDADELKVTFGSAAGSLAGAGQPALPAGHLPLAIVELHSTSGGTGSFDAIDNGDIVVVATPRTAPAEEAQQVTDPSQDTFDLVDIRIPEDRRRLCVYVNGVKLIGDVEYTVVSDTQVILTTPEPTNAVVTFRID